MDHKQIAREIYELQIEDVYDAYYAVTDYPRFTQEDKHIIHELVSEAQVTISWDDDAE